MGKSNLYNINVIRYSDLITIKFKAKIIDVKSGVSLVKLNDIRDHEVKEYFSELLIKYGKYEIVKMIPTANWGDSLVLNKRTGKLILLIEIFLKTFFASLIIIFWSWI